MSDSIAAYLRISVDDDLSSENVSIENQRRIIEAFIFQNFPEASVTYYEDRDLSGYTFESRPAYLEMKKNLLSGLHNIIIVKDFSRFGRRNSLGLLELENFRDAGIRMISVGDGVDYPKNNDWLMIQFRFLMNEIPVTETSKKIRDVIRRRQKDGEWICAVPYGYILDPNRKNKVVADPNAAKVVKEIFSLYNSGWGYKRIANHLTNKGIPSPGKHEGKAWSHVTISRIVKNDFYVGVLRQNVWRREGINKKDRRTDIKEHIVFYEHHEPIIEQDVFDEALRAAGKRSFCNYKGERKHKNPYSGLLFCADCGSPMFATTPSGRPTSYVCGAYHRRGKIACSSHRVKETFLDEVFKSYISRILFHIENIDLKKKLSSDEIKKLNRKIKDTDNELMLAEQSLKNSIKERLRRIAKEPEQAEIINEAFDSAETDIISEINELKKKKNHYQNAAEKKSDYKAAVLRLKDRLEDILTKKQFEKSDLIPLVERITIDENKIITIKLTSNITELFESC